MSTTAPVDMQAVMRAAKLAGCATVPTDMRVSLSPPNYAPSKDSSLGVGLVPSPLRPEA